MRDAAETRLVYRPAFVTRLLALTAAGLVGVLVLIGGYLGLCLAARDPGSVHWPAYAWLLPVVGGAVLAQVCLGRGVVEGVRRSSRPS